MDSRYHRVFLDPVSNPVVMLDIDAQAMMEKFPTQLHLGLGYGKDFVTTEKVPAKSLGTEHFAVHCDEEHNKSYQSTW